MKLITIAACIGLMVAGPTVAQTYRAENRVVVTAQDGGLFAASTNSRYGARGAWCAAADYAHEVLGVAGSKRLFVRIPQSSNSGPVVFGVSSGGLPSVSVTGTTAALRTAGSNLSINHALQFCHDARLSNSRD